MTQAKNWYDGVPAPVDADGNVVPLTTRTLYDGKGREVGVGEIALVDSKLSGGLVWRVRTPGGVALVLDLLHLAPPDSWEQLEKDAANGPCDYFGFATASCVKCPAYEVRFNGCNGAAALDIVRRAKALARRDAKEAR